MPASAGLFVLGVGESGTTPVEARRALAGMFEENSPGVPRSGVVVGPDLVVTGSAAMSYQIAPHVLVNNRVQGEGVYLYSFTGTTAIGTTAAPGTDSRWDLIYTIQLDPEKSDTVNGNLAGWAEPRVLQGAVAAAPVKPYGALPAGAFVLAEARIYSGTTGTNGAPNTITNVFPWAALKGTAVRVRNTTELADITPGIGKTISRLDQGQVLYRGTGTAWQSTVGSSKYAEFTSATKTHTAGKTGPSEYVLDADNSHNADFVNSFGTGANAGTIRITEPGVYLVDLSLNGANASPIAIGSLARFTNEPQTGTYKETSIGGGVAWSDGVETMVRAPANTTAGNPFYVRVITDFRASWTGSTRLRVVQL